VVVRCGCYANGFQFDSHFAHFVFFLHFFQAYVLSLRVSVRKIRSGRIILKGGPCCQMKNMNFSQVGELHRRAGRQAAQHDRPVDYKVSWIAEKGGPEGCSSLLPTRPSFCAACHSVICAARQPAESLRFSFGNMALQPARLAFQLVLFGQGYNVTVSSLGLGSWLIFYVIRLVHFYHYQAYCTLVRRYCYVTGGVLLIFKFRDPHTQVYLNSHCHIYHYHTSGSWGHWLGMGIDNGATQSFSTPLLPLWWAQHRALTNATQKNLKE